MAGLFLLGDIGATNHSVEPVAQIRRRVQHGWATTRSTQAVSLRTQARMNEAEKGRGSIG